MAQGAGSDRARRIAITSWAIIGCIALFVLAIQGLGRIGDALVCLLVGIIVGFICSPITNWLEDLHVKRAAGALISLVIVLAVLVLIVVALAPPFFQQLLILLQHVPTYILQAQDAVRDLFDKYGSSGSEELQSNITSYVAGLSTIGTKMSSDAATALSSGLIPNLMSFVNNLFMSFLGLVLAYWFAKDYPKIVHEFAVIAGPEHEGDLTLLFAVMSRSMGGYMRGILITSTVGGLLSFLGFVIIGHPYAGLMGITVGLLHFVPVIGPWIAAGFAALLALFVSPMLALESLLVSVIAQNVTDNLVSPLVMQSAVKVHPVLSLMAIVIGSSLGGALGMALAIPLSAAIKGVFVYYFETRTGRQLVSYDGALFKSTPFTHEDGTPVPTFDALDDDKFFETSRLVPADTAARAGTVERRRRPENLPMNVADLLRKRSEESHRAFKESRLGKGGPLGKAGDPGGSASHPEDHHDAS